jgi:DNA-binding transcriptional ArsR family regulator
MLERLAGMADRPRLDILAITNILIDVLNEQLRKQAEEVSAVLKQLAHPTRLKVLCCLLEGEKTVSELIAYADASQSWVSQFLARMKLEGLVEARKDGIYVYYRISEPRLKTLMEAIYRAYCGAGKKRKE